LPLNSFNVFGRLLPVMVNLVFLTDEDDRNIKKKLIFFNFENCLLTYIYIYIQGFRPNWPPAHRAYALGGILAPAPFLP
jgi:hypothetical protein